MLSFKNLLLKVYQLLNSQPTLLRVAIIAAGLTVLAVLGKKENVFILIKYSILKTTFDSVAFSLLRSGDLGAVCTFMVLDKTEVCLGFRYKCAWHLPKTTFFMQQSAIFPCQLFNLCKFPCGESSQGTTA